jgi:hypothetical protein
MHRRSALPLRGYFLLGDAIVVISCNDAIVLNCAADAGLIPQAEADQKADLQWEIVLEEDGDNGPDEHSCNVVRMSRSVYISLGANRWFAFDEESGEGAGFVTVHEFDKQDGADITQYLCAVSDTLREGFRHEAKRRHLA